MKGLFCLLVLCLICTGYVSHCDSTMETTDATTETINETETTQYNATDQITTVETTTTEEPDDPCKQPIYSLNGNYNQSELAALDSSVFIKQALLYIFTGCYNDTNEGLPEKYDNNTLDGLIGAAIYAYATEITNNPPENIENALQQIEKWNEIADRLKNNGSEYVYVSDIKEYLNINTPLAVIGLYLAYNKDDIGRRFFEYLGTEFLGGVENEQCRKDSMLWFQDLLNVNGKAVTERLWAFQMLDATSKPPTGIMNANINWVGSYKQCNKVLNEQVTPAIKGRYCNAIVTSPLIQEAAKDFQISEDFGLNIGMCFSSACGDNDVRSIIRNSLKLVGAFKVATSPRAKCDDKDTAIKSGFSIFATVFLSILIGWVCLATIYDVIYQLVQFKIKKNLDLPLQETYNDTETEKAKVAGINVIEKLDKEAQRRKNSSIPLKKKHSLMHQVLTGSSMYSNLTEIFRTDNGGSVTCLNGIRLFSMIWIIVGHTFNYMVDRSYFFLLSNIADLYELNEAWYAQLIFQGMYAVDTFFLMSAFLLTYGFLRKLEKKKTKSFSVPEWIMYYVHRYWRLMPPYITILILYIGVMPYYGNGPLWMARDFPMKSEDCKNYWFTYLTFTNNFLPNGKGTSCMGYLWYIPNDYQFYAISPIFLMLLFKFPRAGKALLSFVLVSSLAVLGFLSANIYATRDRNILATLVDMWEDVYIKPYCRASPYICGILLGYIFFKVKKVRLSYWTVAIGWTLSTSLALSAIFGGFTNHAKDGRRMEVVEYGLFFSLTRLTWSMSIGWIIFACHFGYGGIINTILSCKSYLPLNRISYSCYLIHPPIMVYYFFSQRALIHGDFQTLIYLPIGFTVMTFILAIFYTLFFELPFVAFEKVLFFFVKK